MVDGRLGLEPIGPADHLVHRPESELGHQLAHVLGDEAEVVLDELRLAGELLAQLRVLRRHADRAGVQVADAHHDAARHDERRGRKAEFLGAEQRGDDHVAAGLELAVHLDDDAIAEAVEEQDLLRFGEPELPGDAGVLDRGQRRRAGAAVVTGNQHDVGVRLRHASGDRADADLGDQLDVHARDRVGVLQVVNQLRQVFDRVDVVMRRRRNQRHAWRRVPDLRNPRIDLVPGQLAAFAGLGALRHLDLQVVGVDEVFAGDAEARRRDLLDGAAPRIAVRIELVARRILAAFAGVRLAAEAIHRDGNRLVRFLADRAVRHRAGREALEDRFGRLDFVDRHRRVRSALEIEQAAQRAERPALVVDDLRELPIDRVLPGARRVLQLLHRLGVEEVQLAVAPPAVFAARCRGLAGAGSRAGNARVVPLLDLARR